MVNRRGFLGRAIAAPWVVRSGVLMPVKPLVALAPFDNFAYSKALLGRLFAGGDYGDVSVVAGGIVQWDGGKHLAKWVDEIQRETDASLRRLGIA